MHRTVDTKAWGEGNLGILPARRPPLLRFEATQRKFRNEAHAIQVVKYEARSRDIREGGMIEPSPFEKAMKNKSQSEVRLLLIPKTQGQRPKEQLIIKIPEPASLFT